MKNYEGYIITDDYKIIGIRGKVLTEKINKKGYVTVKFKGGNKPKHIIIAKAFPEICGEWFEGCEVHHLDKNKLNNNPSNLRVLSDKEHNSLHTEKYLKMKGKEPWNKGKSFNEESRIKMSESAKKRGKTYSKPVIQMYNGLIIREWESAMAASKSLNISFKAISACCHHTQKHGGIYEWKFKE